jgi:hypothetical protein
MKTASVIAIVLFTLAPAKSVIQSFSAPAGIISGLGWENGILWAVDTSAETVYMIDPSSGSVTDSFAVNISSGYYATGLAVENDYVYVGAWDNGTNAYVYKYDYSGNYQGSVYMCGG